MSKGSLFWGKATGKLGDMVLSVNKGQQISRAYNSNVANPRTNDQTSNRMDFSQAVKFYKHATSNFFKFAFNDKRKTESDYNVYMRYNVSQAAAVSRENYENPKYPALGNYQLTKGTLPTIIMGTGTNYNKVQLAVTAAPEGGHTVGSLSQAFINKYTGLVNGDIITMVSCVSSLLPTGALQSDPVTPSWDIIQFELDTTSTVDVDDALPAIGVLSLATDGTVTIGDADGSVACFAACIASRKVKGQALQVSTQFVNNNSVAAALIAGQLKADMLPSWGSRGEAILEGGLLQADLS